MRQRLELLPAGPMITGSKLLELAFVSSLGSQMEPSSNENQEVTWEVKVVACYSPRHTLSGAITIFSINLKTRKYVLTFILRSSLSCLCGSGA